MNSQEFKHFKLHADSTLKSMTKDELISYIHMLHNNWKACDEQMCNVMDYNLELQSKVDKLDKALDKACEELHGFDVDKTIEILNRNPQFEEYLQPKSIEQWKEWCLKDE